MMSRMESTGDMGKESEQGQARLISKVIEKGICVQCGACVGLCPYFDYFDGRVVVVDRCQAETWRCLQLCPRAGYEGTLLEQGEKEYSSGGEIGTYQRILAARSSNNDVQGRCQYGGVVSALVMYALHKGHLDCAVLTDSGGTFSPEGRIVRSGREVLDCACSRYSASGTLAALNKALLAGESKVGIVGLPCQMEAAAKMEMMVPDGRDMAARVVLKIGLFCTWAFDYRSLADFLNENGIADKVQKFDIPPPPSEVFQIKTEAGWNELSLSLLRPFIQKGCTLCRDMTAERADISVGVVEGREDWNTVVIRTKKGAQLFEEALDEGWIETDALPGENLEHLKEASLNKRKRAQAAGKEMEQSIP